MHEQMVHQCVSEDLWFRNMLGIDVGAPPLPHEETRLEFMKRYAEDSGKRLDALREKHEPWWEEETQFFDVRRSRAWVAGRLDSQTLAGKIVGEVATRCRQAGVTCHAIVGTNSLDSFDERIIDLASVTEATNLEELKAAGRALV